MRLKQVTLLLALPLSLVCLSGCVKRINATMASWQGHQFSDLVARCGPPSQVMADGQGGKVMVWVLDRTYTTPGEATTTTSGTVNDYGGDGTISATSKTTYTPPETHGWRAYRM
ncbi:MAG TPA: hypothetical protein VFB00_09285, partial [Terriglobales bacterium]|nr:hypothetical protein [Terriglobales bacterium]